MPTPLAVPAAHPTGGSPPRPGPLGWSDLVTQWRLDPLALIVFAAVVAGYVWYRVRGHRVGLTWSARRDVTLAIGVAAGVWVTSGAAQVRAEQLEWAWMAQLLSLLLVVPAVVLAGQPLRLVREVGGEGSPIAKVLRSPVARILGHPLVGPALVPAIFLVLLFGGVGQAAAASPPAGWLLHVVLLVLGALIALPLADAADSRTSLAVGLALAIGFFELFLDVFPGIALRLAGHPVIGYFAGHTPAWAGGWLYQQHQAGGLLWIALEVLDVPFLIFLAARWVRVDAAEAARVDALLDAAAVAGVAGQAGTPGQTGAAGAARAARAAAAPGQEAVGPELAGDGTHPADPGRPWFLDDPQLRDRYRF